MLKFFVSILSPLILSSLTLALTSCQPTSDSTSSSETPIVETVSPAPETPSFSFDTPVTFNGMGTVQIGMTVAEAEMAGNITLEQKPSGGEEWGCFYYGVVEMEDLALMVVEDRIARIDIYTPKVKTTAGIGIGDRKEDVLSYYATLIEEPNEYVQGEYLIVFPDEEANFEHRLVFETDAEGKITRYRTGKLPEVGYIEGCV